MRVLADSDDDSVATTDDDDNDDDNGGDDDDNDDDDDDDDDDDGDDDGDDNNADCYQCMLRCDRTHDGLRVSTNVGIPVQPGGGRHRQRSSVWHLLHQRHGLQQRQHRHVLH